jgi:Ca-activated chloride channel family protein
VQQDVLLYALNVANNNEAPSRFLTESTERTGGRHLTIGADNVVTTAGGIGAEVRNLYELEYNPKNTAHGGAYRTVQVQLIAPVGLPPLNMNYRPGYYEPRR